MKTLSWRIFWATAFALALLVNVAPRAEFLGIKSPEQFVGFWVNDPIDSNGIPHAPDSIHVTVTADNGGPLLYSATGLAYACAGIDTLQKYGRAQIRFSDQIQDIDGAGGRSQLEICVTTWVHLLPRDTKHSVQVIGDSLSLYLRSILDSLKNAATVGQIASKVIDTGNARLEVGVKAAGIAAGDFVAAAITATVAPNLDAAISTRSTLTASDNIGINWADITNPTTTVNFSGSAIGTVGILNALAPAQYTKLADSAQVAVWAAAARVVTGISDSVIIDMSSFNAALDNDTSLVAFLRACLDRATAARDSIHVVHTYLDSLLWWSGYGPNTNSKSRYAADADTVFLKYSTSYVGGLIYFHVGGLAKDPPDSTRFRSTAELGL